MKHKLSKYLAVILALALLAPLAPSARAEGGGSTPASAMVDDILVTPSPQDGHLSFGVANDVASIARRDGNGSTTNLSTPVSVSSLIETVCTDMLTDAGLTNGKLEYLSYVSVAGSQGAIYDGYNNEGDTGAGVAGVRKYYLKDSESNFLIKNIRFVPSASFSGQALVTYYGYYQYTVEEDGKPVVKQGTYAGRIYVTVGKQVPGISYATDGEAVRFAAEDFNTYSLAVTGRAFRYITFTVPTSDKGAMYYNYLDNAIYDAPISSGERYYRSASPSVDNVFFLPAKGFSTPTGDPMLLHFEGIDISGASFSGNVNITVTDYGPGYTEHATGAFTYQVEPGRSVTLGSTSEFSKLCTDELGSGYSFSRIRFMDLPSSSEGILYTGSGTTPAKVNTDYYTSAIPDIRFEANYNFEGTVTVPFRAYAAKSGTTRFVDGDLTFLVEAGSTASPLHYTAAPGKRVFFEGSDFTAVTRMAMNGYSLNRIRFNSLPSSSAGTLSYMNGSSVSSVSVNKDYSSGTLSGISFLAADDFTGSVTIPFTGYSYSSSYSTTPSWGRTFSGTVTVSSTQAAPEKAEDSHIGSNTKTLTYYTSGYAIHLNQYDILNIVSPVLSGTPSTVFLSRPADNEGTLRLDFVSLSHSASYDPRQPHPISDLDRVSFLPKAGFSGTSRITYTVRDASGNSFTGNILFVVTPPSRSAYFSDMDNSRWAIQAVDFFRYYGATTGTSATGFSPNAIMRRGDFILLLSRAFSFPNYGTESFADVPQDKYYSAAVASAKSLGIVGGDREQDFRPDAAISREDAGLYLYRALRRAGSVDPGSGGGYLARFPDAGDVSSYAVEAMDALVREGVFQGYVVSLLPRQTLSRAETITILYRALT